MRCLHRTPLHEVVAGPQRRQEPERRGRSHASGASNSPMSGEGEIGCIFDEISNLVEPIERPSKDGRTG